MRSCVVVLCAVLTVVAVSNPAGASSPMDSIVWQTYDTFSGSSLNTALWTVDKMNGTLSTGAGGLTLSPASLSGGDKNKVSIDASLNIQQDAFFAAQVPFSITMGVPGSGGAVHFAIELDDGSNNWNNIGLGIANNYSSDGTVYNGTFFLSSTNANPSGTPQNTSVTQGKLGLIYSGGMITMYYNDGTGWQQLGTLNSTAGLTGPLNLSLEAQINDSGSLTVVVQNVQLSFTAPAPSLTVTLSGTGSGVVTSAPSGIDCGGTCGAPFASGTALVLTGTPASGSCFIGWGSAPYPVSSYQPYDLTLTSSTSLLATFQPAGTYFCDVPPGYLYETYIETLFTSGVTSGCVSASIPIDRRYCPSEDVPRDQMAAFIVKTLLIKAGQPTTGFTYTQQPYFTDVPSTDPYFPFIQWLSEFAITTSVGTYVPSELVSRGQMAAFLVRALQVAGGLPTESFTYTATPYFTDVPTNNPYFKYVQRLKDLGITAVTGTYGVDNPVPRDQMAAFIARAFFGLQ